MAAFQQLKLLIAISVMYFGFLLHFYLHEALLPKKNPEHDSFNYPSALLFFNAVINTIVGLIAVLVMGEKIPKNPLPYMAVSIPQQAGLACANYANKYIDYVTFQVIKSAKPLSVLFSQILIFRQKVDSKRIFVVILLCTGLSIFGMNGHFGKSSYKGLLFGLGTLLSDAIYVPIVDKLKKSGPYVIMFYNFMWSSLILGIIFYQQIYDAIIYINQHQEILPVILKYGLSGAVAQVALFCTVSLSNGLVVSIATTTRKFFTILLSSLLYRHPLNARQWFGVGLVFFALSIEMFFKQKKTPKKVEENKDQ